MKRIIKLTLLLLAFLMPVTTIAHDIEVDGIYYNINGNEATITYRGSSTSEYSNEYTGEVIIPTTVAYNGATYTVTAIGYSAFYGCSQLTRITIPESITTIGSWAFYNCSGLTSIDIPSSVTAIGSYAFDRCSGLTNIEIPSSVTAIEDYAFYSCSGLTSIDIPNSVTTIGNNAFRFCSGLTSITIPESITAIGYDAFDACTALNTLNFNAISCNDFILDSPPFSKYIKTINIGDSVQRIPAHFAYGLTKLTSITIPESVTSIGNKAFSGCSVLTCIIVDSGNPNYDSRDNCNAIIMTANNSLIAGCNETIIPNSVTAIGDYAFYNCNGLTSIDVPNSVTTIGNYAFYNCSGLTSIDVHNSVMTIGNYAFYNCSGLTSIDIPNSVTAIGNSTFYGCSGLTSITIPESVISIDNYAFYGCTALNTLNFNAVSCNGFNYYSPPFKNLNIQTIIIGNNVQRIPAYFAYKLTKLTNITIPESVTSIGYYAFEGCTALNTLNFNAISCNDFSNPFSYTNINTINIGNNVKTIPANFAHGLTRLTSITIPESVTKIGNSAFRNCSSLKTLYFNADSCADFSEKNHPFEDLNITTIYIGDNVQKVPAYFAYKLTQLASIEIPNSVTNIGNSAFSNCSGLTEMIVESGNPKYDSRDNCNAIIETANNTLIFGCKETTIPNSVTAIGNYAFYYCTGLSSIYIPNSVTAIGNYAFYYCSGLSSIYIPNSVTTIGNYAFYYCTGLTSIDIPNSITVIGNYVFYYCTGLTSIDIPNSVTAIGNYAFCYCTGLTSIDIPNSVTAIGNYAFCYCTGLTSIDIPNSITSIGRQAFNECNALMTLNFNAVSCNDFNYNSPFCNWSIQTINIGNNVQKIPANFAHGLTQLTSITIPESVTAIGDYAFSGCSGMSSMTIPNTVTSIGCYAFDGCSGMNDVNSLIADPSTISMGDDVFRLDNANYSNRILHVPVGSVPYYQTDYNWRPFFSAISDGDTTAAIIGQHVDFEIGDLQYTITSDSTVAVIGYHFSDYYQNPWAGPQLTINSSSTTSLTEHRYVQGNFNRIEIPKKVTHDNINYTVTAIGDSAFYCKDYYSYSSGEYGYTLFALEVDIPETVTSIGYKAVGGYTDLVMVICLSQTPPIINNSFERPVMIFVSAEAYSQFESINNDKHCFSSIHITDGETSDPIEYEVEHYLNPFTFRVYGCRIKLHPKENSVVFMQEAEYLGGLAQEYGAGPWHSTNNYVIGYVNEEYYSYHGWYGSFFAIEEGKSPSYISCDGGIFSERPGTSFVFIDSGIGFNLYDNSAIVTYRTYSGGYQKLNGVYDGDEYSSSRYFDFYSGDIVIPNSAVYAYYGSYSAYPVTDIGTTAFSDYNYHYYFYDNNWDDYTHIVNDSLKSVTLPASIESIGWYAFGNSPNLAYIKCLGLTPPITSTESRELEYNPNVVVNGSFDEGVLQNTTLYVPMAALSAYKAAEGWKNFQHIVGFTDFETDGLYYTITGENEVMVTYGEDAYQGVINIPTNVTYNGVTYDVTGISEGAFTDATLQSVILPVTISYIGNTTFNNCHIGSLVISGNGTWSAGAINCEVDNLYVMSTVTGIQGLQVNPATTVYSYSTLPPTCNDGSFTGYDAALHVPASALAAYFTAPYWNNFINITSDAVEPTGLTINKDSVEVLVGNQLTLTATAIPADATPSEILWTSSDKSIATITNGIITAIHVGECDITAYLLDKTAVCHVTVTEIAPTQITLNQEFAKLEVGSQLTLTATVSPDDATDKYVTWSTTNSAVATVDSLGNVLAVGTGECFIIANCRDNQAMCHIIVVDHFIFITLDEYEVSLLPNHMIVLTPSVMPENTSLTVTSTNPNVAAARLANGKIQVVGITEGRTIIKVNSTDGYAEADSCVVKVHTLRGDVNIDGYVNISDVTSLINHLLGGQDMINDVNADTNNDGKINISDVTRLINYLLGGDELDPKEEPIDGAETFTVNGVSFTMLPVEGGTFTMGATPEQGTSDPWNDERPTHEVTLSTFSIGETEVTQALWQAVMGSNPSEFTGDPSRPVEMVSWDDCQAFIVKLNQMTGRNFRLPTEAEWEYAARGGKKTQGYKYAGSNDVNEVAWWDTNAGDGVGPDSPDYGTHPVASKKANELGLYDMSGNVWEWCQDWYGSYSSEAQTNPTGPATGSNRVYRGGSWFNYARNCRVSSRYHWTMNGTNYMGLRLAL